MSGSLTNPPPPAMRPVVGDMVQYVYHQRDWAAVVTHVHADEIVNLYVFPDASHSFGRSSQTIAAVPYNNGDRWDNTWHWPAQPLDDEAMPAVALTALNG